MFADSDYNGRLLFRPSVTSAENDLSILRAILFPPCGSTFTPTLIDFAMTDNIPAPAQRFAREAMRRKLVTPPQLAVALRHQADLARRGLHVDLARVLIEREIITHDEAQDILVAATRSNQDRNVTIRLQDAGRFLGQFTACATCGTLLCEEDFASGEAGRTAGKTYCRRCLQGGLKPKEVFAGFRVVRELGAGRDGRVYRARDLESNKDVALKIAATTEFQSPTHELRFLEATQQLAELRHENIVAIVRSGRFGRFSYLATEYVSGVSLSDLLLARGKGLPPGFCVHIGLEITAALEYGAQRDLPHGELRPQKILISKEKRIRVADFGLLTCMFFKCARAERENGFFTPPEEDKCPLALFHKDIFALGRILCVALTGKRCLPEDLHDARPDIHQNILSLVQRLSTRDRKKRIRSIRDLKAALLKVATSPK